MRIPEDVAVTGFDDLEEAAGYAPPLTSVSQPLIEMGRQAVRTLLAEVTDGSVAPAAIHLHADLVVCESTSGRSA